MGCFYSNSATTFFFLADLILTLPGALWFILLLCFLLSASVMVRLSFAACSNITEAGTTRVKLNHIGYGECGYMCTSL